MKVRKAKLGQLTFLAEGGFGKVYRANGFTLPDDPTKPPSMSWRPSCAAVPPWCSRSKSPPMIGQEIYALLCCYQAIRTLISHAADGAQIDPARISLTRARDAIRSRISDSGCFPPDRLVGLAADLAFREHLPPQPGPQPPGPPLRTQNQAARRPVQNPQARRDHPADPADQDRLLADASPRLT